MYPLPYRFDESCEVNLFVLLLKRPKVDAEFELF